MKLSVIIPVKNGASTLQRCLQGLRDQTIGKDIEIIVLDSMSVDNSRQIALTFNAVIVDIPDGSFNHGTTRNAGVSYANGEFIFFTVQDAWLSDPNVLEIMVDYFEDVKISSVCGHQAVPMAKNTNPVKWFKRYTTPFALFRGFEKPEDFFKLSMEERLKLSAWDNVIAMYRKSSLEQLPFEVTAFGEDLLWAYHALENGYFLVYDPSLFIYHYHHQRYNYAFKIAFTLNYHLWHFFKVIPAVPPFFSPVIKAAWHLFKKKELDFGEKISWTLHNFNSELGNIVSVLYFRYLLLTSGSKGLIAAYNRICKQIPQGKQKVYE